MASSHRDYVPRNPAQFNVFLQNLIHYVDERTGGTNPQWPDIPTDRLQALKGSHRLFDAAFNEAVAAPTHANILRRKEEQAACVAVLRGFVNQFLRFPPVTNPDRAEMGIPNHDNIRTDQSA